MRFTQRFLSRIATGSPRRDAHDEVKRGAERAALRFTPGEKVKLVGFGVFDVYRRKPRQGRDPYSGTPIKIPGRRVTRFTAGKALKALVK